MIWLKDMRWISELCCLNNEFIKWTKNCQEGKGKRDKTQILQISHCSASFLSFLLILHISPQCSVFPSPKINIICNINNILLWAGRLQEILYNLWKCRGGWETRGVDLFLSTPVFSLHWTQSGRKCVIEASAMRAKQGPSEPIKGCICEIKEQ